MQDENRARRRRRRRSSYSDAINIRVAACAGLVRRLQPCTLDDGYKRVDQVPSARPRAPHLMNHRAGHGKTMLLLQSTIQL